MTKTSSVKINKNNIKPAYIENILLWIVMFIGFITFFFLTLDYASIIRVKDNMDALSDYGAENIAINGIGNNISTNLNNITIGIINNITSTDLICTPTTDNTFQVIFITQTTNNSYKFYSNQLSSRRVVFNQVNSDTVTCILNITLAN